MAYGQKKYEGQVFYNTKPGAMIYGYTVGDPVEGQETFALSGESFEQVLAEVFKINNNFGAGNRSMSVGDIVVFVAPEEKIWACEDNGWKEVSH